MRQSGEESNPAPSQALKVSFQEAMANILGAISPKRTVQPEQEPAPRALKSEALKSDLRPEDLKPEDPSSEEPKPEEPKPEELRPEELRPEELRPEELRPEELRPEELRPEEPKSGNLARPVRAIEPAAPYDIADAMADVAGAIAEASPRRAAPKPAIEPVAAPRNDWQPIATAPMDRAVQVGVTSRNGVLAVFFPCRLTGAGWINALVRAPLLHEPACWREWRDYHFDAN
jgi:hypothetical protein